MKKYVLRGLLLFLILSPSYAQDQVLATSQGYQLRQSTLAPAINFLNFLIQGQITQDELNYLLQMSLTEFQANPQGFLNEMNGFNQSIAQAQGISDPIKLGEFRQKVIGEFFAAAQTVPQNQIPAYLQVLFRRAPVVAFDPKTKAALTQLDLQASLLYVQELYALQGQQVPPQMLETWAQQLVAGFTQLDQPTQNFLASGNIVLSIYRANVARMNQQQQQAMAQQYTQAAQNQGGGYTPATTASGKAMENWHNQQTFQIMQNMQNQSHVTMMNVIENMGGSDNYWTLEPSY